MNNSEIMSEQFKNDLMYLAIPTVIENHIHYIETKKEKYNFRKKHALKKVNKPLLISIITDLIKIKGVRYSKTKINMLRTLLKEIN